MVSVQDIHVDVCVYTICREVFAHRYVYMYVCLPARPNSVSLHRVQLKKGLVCSCKNLTLKNKVSNFMCKSCVQSSRPHGPWGTWRHLALPRLSLLAVWPRTAQSNGAQHPASSTEMVTTTGHHSQPKRSRKWEGSELRSGNSYIGLCKKRSNSTVRNKRHPTTFCDTELLRCKKQPKTSCE